MPFGSAEPPSYDHIRTRPAVPTTFQCPTNSLFIQGSALPRLEADPATSSAPSCPSRSRRYRVLNPNPQGESGIPDRLELSIAQATEDTITDLPPRYSSLSTHIVPEFTAPQSTSPSQAVRGNKGFKEHEFQMKDRNKAWALLKVISRVPLPGSVTSAPRYIGGDLVKGVVELDYGVKVKNVYLRLTGKMVSFLPDHGTLDNTIYLFLDYKHQIYSRGVNSGDGDRSTIEGLRIIPFEFSFPSSTSLGNGRNRTCVTTDCLIPQSFLEKGATASIKYELSLIVDHGGLKLNSKLYIPVTYMPKVVPPPASENRQLAYRQGARLLGPLSDPDGWVTCAPVLDVVRLGNDIDTKVVINLFLARPLSYTRGTVIPCYLTISCVESYVLEAPAIPDMIDVRLVRRIKSYVDPNYALNHQNSCVSRQEFILSTGTAVWWDAPNVVPELGHRWLEGEIHLGKGLQPSCDFIPFTIEYAIEIMPLVVNQPLSNCARTCKSSEQSCSSKPLFSQAIQIASFHEHGILPTPFTTPSQEEEPQCPTSELGLGRRKSSFMA